ncbi:spermidine synthase [Metabacillus sp. JX24]|uniref:spermine/spermidine synthase domain-containing protein n=1 Tax=Metabacillus sp. JX24 TaxID=3240759 RepID=UPI0035105468
MSRNQHSKPWTAACLNKPSISSDSYKKQTPSAYLNGDNRDKIALNELKKRKHRNLFDQKSSFQDIQIVEVSDLRMYLDGQLQFSSLDEKIYHEALVHPAFAAAPEHERVLILGGGDGLALREVLKYSGVKHADLVDLDPLVLKAAKEIGRFAALNNYSLRSKRVHVHPMDAQAFLAAKPVPYDIIFVDFPDPSGKTISDLYTTEFYSILKKSLKPDGVFVCQANSPVETPLVFWTIGKTIESAGFAVTSYHTTVPSFGDWGFHLASATRKSFSGKTVQVSAKSLPSNLGELSKFPSYVTEKKNQGIINTKNKSVLHTIFKKESFYMD